MHMAHLNHEVYTECPLLFVCVSHSVVSDSVTPRAVAHQASLSMEFSRWEYWSELPFPSPEELPTLKPWSPASQAHSLPFELQGILQSESHSVLSSSSGPRGLYSPWSSPGQNTGVGRFFPSVADLPNPGIELESPELSGKPPLLFKRKKTFHLRCHSILSLECHLMVCKGKYISDPLDDSPLGILSPVFFPLIPLSFVLLLWLILTRNAINAIKTKYLI